MEINVDTLLRVFEYVPDLWYVLSLYNVFKLIKTYFDGTNTTTTNIGTRRAEASAQAATNFEIPDPDVPLIAPTRWKGTRDSLTTAAELSSVDEV